VSVQLERIWKEAFVAYFKVLPPHSPGGTDENERSRPPVQNLNRGPPVTKEGC
jgi:hypothetical protein